MPLKEFSSKSEGSTRISVLRLPRIQHLSPVGCAFPTSLNHFLGVYLGPHNLSYFPMIGGRKCGVFHDRSCSTGTWSTRRRIDSPPGGWSLHRLLGGGLLLELSKASPH